MATKFREHRGGLAESMETVVEVETKADLAAHMRSKLAPFGFNFEDADLMVKPYGENGLPMHDERIGWDTYVVTIEGYGVAGFTNGALV